MREKSAADARRPKLDQLVELEGYTNLDELLEAAAIDSVSLAICFNEC